MKATPTSTITCPNPRCQRQHALFWYVNSKGRQLSYRCDRVERQGKAKHDGAAIVAVITSIMAAPPSIVPANGLPMELSRAAAKKAEARANYQLPLMK